MRRSLRNETPPAGFFSRLKTCPDSITQDLWRLPRRDPSSR
jgi:hypothetical protein